jgi:HD-GYP domain-containing protein (c-di-GMP phosphodiesterase class II)
MTGLVHDLGKVGLPDCVLRKPEPPTPEEWDLIRRHPDWGADALAEMHLMPAAVDGVRAHHERWDGSGYPEGLRGEEIPLLGRLLGVADFYDAITSTRPYRAALTPEQAVALLREGSGTHFDARIVEAVLRLYERDDLLPQGWEDLLPARGHAVLSPPGGG